MRHVWAAVLLAGCGFTGAFEPQLRDDLVAIDLEFSDDTADPALTTPVALGVSYQMRWTGPGEPTLDVEDTGVLTVGEAFFDEEENDWTWPVSAVGAGATEVRVRVDGDVVDTDAVEVSEVDGLALVPFPAVFVDDRSDEAAYAAGVPVYTRVYRTFGGEPVYGRLGLPEVTPDGVTLEPVATNEQGPYEVVIITVEAGTTTLEWPVSNGTLPVSVAGIASEALNGARTACGETPAGPHCVAIGQIGDIDVWGIPATWTLQDGTVLSGIGDAVRVSGTDGATRPVTVSWEAWTAPLEIGLGEATVVDSSEWGCSSTGGAPAWALLLLPLALVRRRSTT